MPQTPEAIEPTKSREKIINDIDKAIQDSAAAIEVFSDRGQVTKTANRLLNEHEFAVQEKVPSKTLIELIRSIREFQGQLERRAEFPRTH